MTAKVALHDAGPPSRCGEPFMRPASSLATLVFVIIVVAGAALSYATYGISASWGGNWVYHFRPYRRHCCFLRHQGRGSVEPGRRLAARSLSTRCEVPGCS